MGWARALHKDVIIVRRKGSVEPKSDYKNDTYHDYDDNARSIDLARVIRENIVEFTEENAKLLEKYPTLNEHWKNKEKVNFEIYQKSQSYNLTCLELSEFPSKTPPFIVGIFGY